MNQAGNDEALEVLKRISHVLTTCQVRWEGDTVLANISALVTAGLSKVTPASDLPQLLGSLIEAVTDACDSTNSGDQMQAAMRKADGIRLDIERRFALSATSPSNALVEACRGLVSYWTRNLRTFQWEKADDHVKRINAALPGATEGRDARRPSSTAGASK